MLSIPTVKHAKSFANFADEAIYTNKHFPFLIDISKISLRFSAIFCCANVDLNQTLFKFKILWNFWENKYSKNCKFCQNILFGTLKFFKRCFFLIILQVGTHKVDIRAEEERKSAMKEASRKRSVFNACSKVIASIWSTVKTFLLFRILLKTICTRFFLKHQI